MVERLHWIRKILEAWDRRSVVWLSGVRRVGKTFLSRSIDGVEYFDCELPRTRALMEDPEGFLSDLRGRRVVLDEIHRLADPASLLKIAADHYPDVSILATGSSTLGASARFRDTLTGRKVEIWLTPLVRSDLDAFGIEISTVDSSRGGLPPFFLADPIPEADFQEWVDSFWAKDEERTGARLRHQDARRGNDRRRVHVVGGRGSRSLRRWLRPEAPCPRVLSADHVIGSMPLLAGYPLTRHGFPKFGSHEVLGRRDGRRSRLAGVRRRDDRSRLAPLSMRC